MGTRPGATPEIQPGTKVIITIEATVMQAHGGSTAVDVAYGEDNEHLLALTAFDLRSGVTIGTA